jgi:hypothetical protein
VIDRTLKDDEAALAAEVEPDAKPPISIDGAVSSIDGRELGS